LSIVSSGRTPTTAHAARFVRALALVVAMLVATFARTTSAEDVAVPIALQAELLAKVAGYDRNLPARAGERVRVAILTKPDDADSQRATVQMRGALGAVERIGALPHEELVVPFGGRDALAAIVREQHISIVYVTPGLSADIDAIRAALDGQSVLSATALPSDVARGVVLGFDLVSGRTKLLVNLPQMRRQNVALPADILKLAKVIE
jgi:hypothetical protein